MFSCQECGRKYRTAKAAERAVRNGCSKCGGTDIDIDCSSTTPGARYAARRDSGFQRPLPDNGDGTYGPVPDYLPPTSGQSYKCGRCGAYLMFHDSICDCQEFVADWGAHEEPVADTLHPEGL